MALMLVRRIVFAVLGVWISIMAVEEFRLSGHLGPALGLSAAGVFLFVIAALGKGG